MNSHFFVNVYVLRAVLAPLLPPPPSPRAHTVGGPVPFQGQLRLSGQVVLSTM